MNELVNYEAQDGSIFGSLSAFETAEKIATVLSKSTMVPEAFRGNIPNCIIALELSNRLRLPVFMLMQTMFVIHGKPGIEGKLVIAMINNSGKFTPLCFDFSGIGDTRKCIVSATHKASGERKSAEVSWAMVSAEGWDKKSGSKWKTIPDQMFQYRAAVFFGRIHCPELTLGLQTTEELEDLGPQQKDVGQRISSAFGPQPQVENIEGKTIEAEPDYPDVSSQQPQENAMAESNIFEKVLDVKVIQSKPGEKKKWTLFKIKTQSMKLSTFDKKIGEHAQTLIGKNCAISFEMDGNNYVCKAIEEEKDPAWTNDQKAKIWELCQQKGMDKDGAKNFIDFALGDSKTYEFAQALINDFEGVYCAYNDFLNK